MLHCVRLVARRQPLVLFESSRILRDRHTTPATQIFYASASSFPQLQRQPDLLTGDRVLPSQSHQGQDHHSIATLTPVHRKSMAGFSEPLDGGTFPTLGGATSQFASGDQSAERRTSAGRSASSLQENLANTSISDQGLVSGGARRGWGNAPGASATYIASRNTSPGTSRLQSGLGASVPGAGGTGAPAATGKGRDRQGKEVLVADEEGELEAAATPSGRRGGGARGRGEGRGGSGGGRGRAGDQIENLGRSLTQILRHSALEHGLVMRLDGFVRVSEILQLQKKTRSGRPLSSHSQDDVRQAAALDKKGRMELREEGGELWIRATQGHSIKIIESEALLRPVTSASEVPVCVHGTYARYLDAIFRDGLKTMKRNHVHFASGLPKEDGVISGMRASCEVLIFLDVEKALQDGMKLWVSSNGVILTEGLDGAVPRQYFKEVCTVRGRQNIPVPP